MSELSFQLSCALCHEQSRDFFTGQVPLEKVAASIGQNMPSTRRWVLR